jgi:thiamine pyrophosphokinase
MEKPLDWRTRLAVTYVDETGKKVNVTPIDSFSPTFQMNAEVHHSIERTHIGTIFMPESITFALTVKAIGDVAAQLTALALNGQRFDITLHEYDGTDWAFKTVVLRQCLITSASPSNATISGAPSATFSGFSLQASAEPKQGAAVSIP